VRRPISHCDVVPAGTLPHLLFRKAVSSLGRTMLWVGLVLTINACSTRVPAPVESREAGGARAADIRSDIHRVAGGDTLYSIAWNAGLDYRQVAAWNGIGPPYTIYPGQELSLRPTASGPTLPVSTPKVAEPRPDKPASPPAGRSPRPRLGSAGSTAADDTLLESRSRLKWRWPTVGRVVQTFVPKDRTRQGIKITGTFGQAILAAERGRVVYSGSGLIGYGQLVIIKHNPHFLSAYGHNRTILVREGDRVGRGEKIAEMGRANDGTIALHFEIRQDGVPTNPLHLLPKQG